MNLHQFRFVQEAVRRNLNLTETAKALFTSQPGISKAILELEEELGVDIFARHGLGVRPIIRLASVPTARGRPSCTLMATTEGSLRTMPRPRT